MCDSRTPKSSPGQGSRSASLRNCACRLQLRPLSTRRACSMLSKVEAQKAVMARKHGGDKLSFLVFPYTHPMRQFCPRPPTPLTKVAYGDHVKGSDADETKAHNLSPRSVDLALVRRRVARAHHSRLPQRAIRPARRGHHSSRRAVIRTRGSSFSRRCCTRVATLLRHAASGSVAAKFKWRTRSRGEGDAATTQSANVLPPGSNFPVTCKATAAGSRCATHARLNVQGYS